MSWLKSSKHGKITVRQSCKSCSKGPHYLPSNILVPSELLERAEIISNAPAYASVDRSDDSDSEVDSHFLIGLIDVSAHHVLLVTFSGKTSAFVLWAWGSSLCILLLRVYTSVSLLGPLLSFLPPQRDSHPAPPAPTLPKVWAFFTKLSLSPQMFGTR